MDIVKKDFTLSGLTCSSCEKIVGKRLSKIDGVQEVSVSALNGMASVISTRPIMAGEVSKALEDTHYHVVTN